MTVSARAHSHTEIVRQGTTRPPGNRFSFQHQSPQFRWRLPYSTSRTGTERFRSTWGRLLPGTACAQVTPRRSSHGTTARTFIVSDEITRPPPQRKCATGSLEWLIMSSASSDRAQIRRICQPADGSRGSQPKPRHRSATTAHLQLIWLQNGRAHRVVTNVHGDIHVWRRRIGLELSRRLRSGGVPPPASESRRDVYVHSHARNAYAE